MSKFWDEVQPKIKAVAAAVVVYVAGNAVAYFNGTVTLNQFIAASVSGAGIIVAGWVKSNATEIITGVPVDVYAGDDNADVTEAGPR